MARPAVPTEDRVARWCLTPRPHQGHLRVGLRLLPDAAS